ncbi:zinc finger protein 436-like [Copidosoma floridanum]|uniref:zinc finger protein 436-like n=1 Tax=Copidosoma floridanum TaxID=29053 RepID=UPI000C6F5059|nr:zinc finger protein 436-like [Copidosoma floridanum]
MAEGGNFDSCDVCVKTCKTNDALDRHGRAHTDNQANVCGHKRIHTDDKSYKCQVCLQSFSHKHYLIRHKKTHAGEKPHICQVCLKSFLQKSDLTKHKKYHSA